MSKIFRILAILISCSIFSCQESIPFPEKSSYDIIPTPTHLETAEGFFQINADTKIILLSSNEEMKENARYLTQIIKEKFSFELAIETSPEVDIKTVKNGIILLEAKAEPTADTKEAYYLGVKADNVVISSTTGSGSFYGIQTLLQLLQGDTPFIAAVVIEDAPRYSYRGMHLDVARHFFPPSFIKQYIDYLARYKYNSFHWHLTEDQGWRIEIKKYPKLQEIAAFRKETLIGHYSDLPQKFDGKRYGGFYTQEEIKDIVAYAKTRHITVIPEIEMPGHAQAAIAAYPELGCTEELVEVATKWGVFKDVYCPTETTFNFLEDVLTEVMALFPSKYIHIGGDECPKTAWEESEFCQDLIKKEGLKDEHELQSYFIQRMEKFLNGKGRSIIGWDEILEGGLAPNATVMSWRGMKGGIEAAEQGHDVIMTPGSHCYFDHYQSDAPDEPLAIGGYTSLEKVYSFEPTPPTLSPEHAKHILGAQGNVWTEYLNTTAKVEYMIFPRIAALSEVLWSSKENKDYGNFVARLEPHVEELKAAGVNVANHTFDVKSSIISADGVHVQLKTGAKSPTIHYTLDGSDVTVESPKYTERVAIKKSGTLKASAFKNNEIAGRSREIPFNIHKAAGKSIILANEPSEKYNTGGNAACFNGVNGSDVRYGDAEWLGFKGEDFIATVNLGESTEINSLKFRFFNNPHHWIFPPQSVEIFVSADGENFNKAGELTIAQEDVVISKPVLNLTDTKATFIKIHIHRHGLIEKGHAGVGKEAWLFVDEIIVE